VAESKCPKCKGEGRILRYAIGQLERIWRTCPACRGTGMAGKKDLELRAERRFGDECEMGAKDNLGSQEK